MAKVMNVNKGIAAAMRTALVVLSSAITATEGTCRKSSNGLGFYLENQQQLKKECETWADIKDSHGVPEILQKNWFSDGGICSNFPIHFFDDWLPNRPTFGINLTTLPDEEALQDQGAQRTVNKDYQSASFKPVNYEGQLVTGQVREDVSDVYLPKADENVPPD